MTRVFMLFLALISVAACGGTSIQLRSEVAAGHVVIVGIEGETVTIENVGKHAVELRRRAPTGEVVGTQSLAPGATYTTSANERGAVELVNAGSADVGFHVRAIATEDGTARVVILANRDL